MLQGILCVMIPRVKLILQHLEPGSSREDMRAPPPFFLSVPARLKDLNEPCLKVHKYRYRSRFCWLKTVEWISLP